MAHSPWPVSRKSLSVPIARLFFRVSPFYPQLPVPFFLICCQQLSPGLLTPWPIRDILSPRLFNRSPPIFSAALPKEQRHRICKMHVFIHGGYDSEIDCSTGLIVSALAKCSELYRPALSRMALLTARDSWLLFSQLIFALVDLSAPSLFFNILILLRGFCFDRERTPAA